MNRSRVAFLAAFPLFGITSVLVACGGSDGNHGFETAATAASAEPRLLTSGFAGIQRPQDEPSDTRRPKVLTQNMFQGTEVGEAIAAKDVPSFLQAVATDFQQVQASKIPERTAAMAAEIADSEPDLVGLQEVALWRTGAFGVPPATAVAYDMLQSLLDELTVRGLH